MHKNNVKIKNAETDMNKSEAEKFDKSIKMCYTYC